MILDQHQQPDPAMCRVCCLWRGDLRQQEGGAG
jgi:hypothetical protein